MCTHWLSWSWKFVEDSSYCSRRHDCWDWKSAARPRRRTSRCFGCWLRCSNYTLPNRYIATLYSTARIFHSVSQILLVNFLSFRPWRSSRRGWKVSVDRATSKTPAFPISFVMLKYDSINQSINQSIIHWSKITSLVNNPPINQSTIEKASFVNNQSINQSMMILCD